MKAILQTYKLAELKKMVRETNIRGYSKLKKDELIKVMILPENIDRFKSIKPKSQRVGGARDTKPKIKVLKEFKKLSKPYQQKKEFEEDAKMISEKLSDKMLPVIGGKKIIIKVKKPKK